MSKIVIGKIVNTFGLKGELKVMPEDKNFASLKNLHDFYIQGFNDCFKCEKITNNGKFAKIKIFGFDDINMVLQFKNKNILVETEDELQLAENEYLTKDIIGSKVFDCKNQIATIVEVENFGATDILVLDMNGVEARVPFVEIYFDVVNPKEKIFVISKQFFEGVVWK